MRRRLLRRSFTPVAAVRAIGLTTLLVTLVAGTLIHFVDRDEFPTFGRGLWWATETVTTVGYGDVVPTAVGGRIVAVFVMLSGLAFLTVATAAISARLVHGARREPDLGKQLSELNEKLERLEAALRDRRAA